MRRLPKANEDNEQTTLMAMVETHLGRYPELRWLHHSPNGGKRDVRVAQQLKRMGVKKGFPDLILPVRRGDKPGLVIEMKFGEGKTSPEQKEWLAHFSAQGWEVSVAYGFESAWARIRNYLNTEAAS